MRMWWKSIGGLKAWPNDSSYSSLVYLNCCYIAYVYVCWEEMKLVDMGTLGENKFMSREFDIYMHVFKSSIANIIVDGVICLLYKLLRNCWDLI
jgi:hypothetical protein